VSSFGVAGRDRWGLRCKDGVIAIRGSIADGGPGLGTYRKSTKRDDWRDVPLTEQLIEMLEELFAIRRANFEVLGLKIMAPVVLRRAEPTTRAPCASSC
jgi:hypothetical protein